MPGEVVGTLIGAFELTDPNDCLLKCEGSEGCTWFTHHTREEFCALYSEMQEINVQRCPSCVSGKDRTLGPTFTYRVSHLLLYKWAAVTFIRVFHHLA